MRILSGIQPSGELHIGNYFGMMKNMIKYQNRGELFCFIANLHSLTSVFDKDVISKRTVSVATDFLALGIDPEKSYFWVQSDVPEVTELAWYLSNVTPLGLLQRCHAYKDKVDKGLPANNGLFTYPVLMAADILAFGSEIVPVGQDQKQHVEVTRDVAERFNNTYGEVFTIPEPEVQEEVAVVPGTDGKKMSKSYGNTIEIFGNEKEIKKKIMRIVTDSTPVDQPKNPEKCTVYTLYKLFATPEESQEMADKYRAGGYGYGDAKKELVRVINEYYEPYREKHNELSKKPDYIKDVLREGAKKSKAVARGTLERVRETVGVNY